MGVRSIPIPDPKKWLFSMLDWVEIGKQRQQPDHMEGVENIGVVQHWMSFSEAVAEADAVQFF